MSKEKRAIVGAMVGLAFTMMGLALFFAAVEFDRPGWHWSALSVITAGAVAMAAIQWPPER